MQNSNMDSLKRNHGFTLVELLVAMSIFVVVSLISVTVFAQIIRSQTYLNDRRNLQEEGRFLLEKIVKELKNGTIDYPQYHMTNWPGTTYAEYIALPHDATHPPSINDNSQISNPNCLEKNCETTLNIVSPDGLSQTKLQRNTISSVVEISTLHRCNGADEWDPDSAYTGGFLPLSKSSIEVTKLEFFITPLKDPSKVFDDDNVQYQPTVIILLDARDPVSNAMLSLQTSVATRIYEEVTWADATSLPACI